MTDFADKRRSRRARSLLKGQIIFNNRFSIVDCSIRDISDTGARIAFAHPIDIPREFELDIPKKGSVVRARVVWSNGNEHGVVFDSEPQIQGPTSPLPHHRTALDRTDIEIQDILEEARRRIADLTRAPVNAVKLSLHIEQPE
jgi:hypothetical protein